jgi:condensin complex subunit 3
LKHLLDVCNAKDKAVRFRACQTVSKTLHHLEEGTDLDDIYEGLEKTMLKRIEDKIPGIRVQAINALGRLQDVQDADCPIVAAYLSRMANDSSPGEL